MGKGPNNVQPEEPTPDLPILMNIVPAPSGLWLFGYVPTPDVGPNLLAIPVVSYLCFNNGAMRPISCRHVHGFVELAVLHESEIEPEMRKRLFEHRWTKAGMEKLALNDHHARVAQRPLIVSA